MEKKVTLSENIYNKLMNDMEIFDYHESKNDFYSDIIIHTYNYDNHYHQMDKIIELLTGKNKACTGNFIIEEIKDLKNEFQFKDMLNQIALEITKLNEHSYPIIGEKKEIFIRETARSQGELNRILNEFGASHASDVFKNLIYQYMSYPTYIREQIICSNISDTILECIRRKIKCRIRTRWGEFIIEPYKMVPGKDEYYNYISCYSTETTGKFERTIQCFKLHTILSASRLRESYALSEEEISILSNRINDGGPEYVSNPLFEYQVEFDNRGIKLWDSITKDRPACINKQNGRVEEYKGRPQQYMIYTIKSTEFQILNYLKQFSYHVRILNNDELKTKLKEYYRKANEKFDA